MIIEADMSEPSDKKKETQKSKGEKVEETDVISPSVTPMPRSSSSSPSSAGGSSRSAKASSRLKSYSNQKAIIGSGPPCSKSSRASRPAGPRSSPASPTRVTQGSARSSFFTDEKAQYKKVRAHARATPVTPVNAAAQEPSTAPALSTRSVAGSASSSASDEKERYREEQASSRATSVASVGVASITSQESTSAQSVAASNSSSAFDEKAQYRRSRNAARATALSPAVVASTHLQEPSSTANVASASTASTRSSTDDEKAKYRRARASSNDSAEVQSVGNTDGSTGKSQSRSPILVTTPGAVAVVAAEAGMPDPKEGAKVLTKDEVDAAVIDADVTEKGGTVGEAPDPQDTAPPGLAPSANYSRPGAFRMSLSMDEDVDQSEHTLSPLPLEESPLPQDKPREEYLIEASLVEEPPVVAGTTSFDAAVELVEASPVPEANNGFWSQKKVKYGIPLLLLLAAGGTAGVVLALLSGGSDVEDSTRDLPVAPTASPTTASPTQSPSAAPSMFPSAAPSAFTVDRFQEEFLPEYSQEALLDPLSSQSEALAWLEKSIGVGDYSNVKRLQRFALATLFYATDGERWSDNNGWLSDDEECDWYSDTLGATFVCFDGKYQTLQLDENSLLGTLPADVAILTDLLSLQLGRNDLFGSIPSEYGSLTNLRVVSLFGGLLEGPIPSELRRLTALQSVDLSRNRLSSQIPKELIRGWTDIRSLDVSVNELGGFIPTEVGLLKKAARLGVSISTLNVY